MSRKPEAQMTCPRCGEQLEERDRADVTVDVCVGCRGLWLDRGELEKLLARAAREAEEHSVHAGNGGGYGRAPDSDRGGYGRAPDSDRGGYGRAPDSDRRPHGKKRWSLMDIFD